MGNAGRNGGEYYTPRPLIRAIVAVTAPKLGETICDPAVGSAGFLCESFEYLKAQNPHRTTAQDRALQERTFYGKEKKSLAYVIAIMNMILHGIEAPNILHTNTLAEIASARATVSRGIDLVQVHTDFEIGRRIVEQEQKGKGRAAYGEEVIKALAERLVEEFGRGFSERNLASMKAFYLQYRDRRPILQTPSAKFVSGSKSQPLTGQSEIFQALTGKSQPRPIAQTVRRESALRPFTLSWSHYVFLLSIKSQDERSFYEIESTSQDWTLKELKRQFDSSLYERLALSRDKKGIRRLAQEAAGLLGSPLLVPESDRFLHNQRLGLVRKKPGVAWTNEFFFHVFNTQPVRKAIHASASGVKVRHTSPTKIGDVVVPFPTSLPEQKRIVTTLASLTAETQRLARLYERKLAALEALKKSLLHQAFTGEL